MRHRSQAVYVISVAAELAGMHPQTLRIYERRGLVNPARTQGGNRRYSDEDIEVLRRITELAAEGMNLEGIRRVMQLEAEVERLRAELAESREAARQAVSEAEARQRRDLVPLRQAMAVFGERPGFLARRPLAGRVGRRQPARVIVTITRSVGPGLNSATSPKPSSTSPSRPRTAGGRRVCTRDRPRRGRSPRARRASPRRRTGAGRPGRS